MAQKIGGVGTELVPKDPGIPNGWFAVAWSHELGAGEVKRVYCFEHELVLFRAHSGEPKVLSAYCPHLGIHMAKGGRVMGETLRCPQHGWQFDGDSGKCTEIPYCDEIPKRARVRTWEVVERNHMILVWHHAEEKPPNWEVPVVSQLGDPEWCEPRTFTLEVPVHMQDMAENNLDPVHFLYVHGMGTVPETEFNFSEDGRFLKATSYVETVTPNGSLKISLIRDTWGLGLSSVESAGIPGVGLFMFTSTTPIDNHNTITRWLLFATKNALSVVGEEWFATITKGVMDDWDVWTNKIHIANPVFCKADTPLIEFRKWARQFYSDPVG
ncbi:MAG: FeS-binding protein [Deltaproteobacteria bacterium]|jgi:nitrite reductase/ring-hydroxylating ferredoxin subunit|nr:FeS-binding protein [Deltaproteobacteria bacterium]